MDESSAPRRAFGADLFTETFPSSWYPVARSRALRPGDVRAVKVAGTDMVLFRTRAGRACVLDRYCPHMGASLAAGCVVGERIRCSFHRWAYDTDGTCGHIPYLDGAQIPKAAQVRSHPVVEKFGTIYVANHDRPPPLSDFPELDDPEFLRTESEIPIPIHQLAFMENAVDYMHITQLHDVACAHADAEVVREEPGRIDFLLDFRKASYRGLLPLGDFRVSSVFVLPNVNFGALEVNGRVQARWILATQAVDATRTIVFATWSFRRPPLLLRPLAPLYLRSAGWAFDGAVKLDIRYSWEGMRPDLRRVWLREDRQIRRFHTFYRSFMPEQERRDLTPARVAGLS
jgi:nitrite reductase/ring-hydroxylating ferredoxin subunit